MLINDFYINNRFESLDILVRKLSEVDDNLYKNLRVSRKFK